MEICEEISSPSIFRKMLMSAFPLRFKANYLKKKKKKMRAYPLFSLWVPIALTKIYFVPRGPHLAQKLFFI